MSGRSDGDDRARPADPIADPIADTGPRHEAEAADPAPLAVISSWRRRVAALALVAGAAVALGSLAPSWPQERTIELRVPQPSSVRRVEVVWSRPGGTEPVVVKASAWAFTSSSAPSSIVTSIDLADGTYDVDIQVERADRATAARRLITVGDADRITLPLP